MVKTQMLLFAINKIVIFCPYKLHDILFKKLMPNLLEVWDGRSHISIDVNANLLNFRGSHNQNI